MQSIIIENGQALLPKVEFYINHTCNLTCTNCNRFNNHNFVGWQSWDDYADKIKQWSTHIKIDHIVIMGGEPTLNPTLVKWVQGLNSVFDRAVQIVSNGTHLLKVKGLYDLLESPTFNGHRNWLSISLHNINFYPKLISDLKELLSFEGTTEEFLVGYKGPIKMGHSHYVVGKNGVGVEIVLQNEFSPAAIIVQNGRYTLHNNNPVQAHGDCGFVKFKCYHMVKGKLYKCGPVALFPEFNQQHNLDISDEDKKLINSYVPLDVSEFEIRGAEFFETLDDVIPQCKFCPVNDVQKYNSELIFPEVKNKK